jgi:hypothetical protein
MDRHEIRALLKPQRRQQAGKAEDMVEVRVGQQQAI